MGKRAVYKRFLGTDVAALLPTTAEEEAMSDSPLRLSDGRLNLTQMRNFLKCISAMADDVLKEIDQIEKLVTRAEKQLGPPAQLFLMPDRKDLVQ
jgi:hypothetical protein